MHFLDNSNVIATGGSENIHLKGFQIEPLLAFGWRKFKFDEFFIVLELINAHQFAFPVFGYSCPAHLGIRLTYFQLFVDIIQFG